MVHGRVVNDNAWDHLESMANAIKCQICNGRLKKHEAVALSVPRKYSARIQV